MSRFYPQRPVVGIGIVVIRHDAVLLVRRAHPPAQGSWSLPGGAQELGETAEEGAHRELMEETGLSVPELQLVAHADSIHRDDAGKIVYHYTILDFAGRWQEGDPRAGSDVSEVAWADFADLKKYNLWDEAHRVIARARHLLVLSRLA